MLQTFVPLFSMTFFICLFIVLMQFLWRSIDDLVGKGLSISVIAELFFYAALSLIPMALPLAILLASLMTFGNLGERFELTAMKAAGVSLVKAMRPLMWFIGLVAVGAFFFQNDVMPVTQTKMWTLLYSMRQKSPEVEIPEGVFYDQIPGYNLFVQKKNPETGMLYDLMIYNMSDGFENASTILADSGRLAFSEDKTHLYLHLWQGESFENLRQAGGNSKNVPYRRETFAEKELLMKFDANFNRLDEQGFRNQYVGKNISQLKSTMDSVGHLIDSIATTNSRYYTQYPYFSMTGRVESVERTDSTYSGPMETRRVFPTVVMEKPIDIDSLFKGKSSSYASGYVATALNKAKRQQQELEFKTFPMLEELKTMRRHGIEMHKKFTLSFACIIFFFIGAPLGAIIRKGGLGTPLIISVILFIVYYIIDNTGYKMARDGKLEVWEGIWLSSLVLLPLGIFFTYKAVNDSSVFNPDAYRNFIRKLLGRHQVRKVEWKEIVMDTCENSVAAPMVAHLKAEADMLIGRYGKWQSYWNYFLSGINRNEVGELIEHLEATVAYLSNSRNKMVVLKLMDYPIIRNPYLLHPTGNRIVAWTLMALFPIGGLLWLIGNNLRSRLVKECRGVVKTSGEVEVLLADEKEKNRISDNT